MSRTAYYQELKKLARQVRTDFSLTTPRVMLSDLRRIYKHYEIRIEYCDRRLGGIRGAYFNDETGPWVLVDKALPKEQRIFTLAHELKHHLTGDVIGATHSTGGGDPVEIGAELFAAELIYPEDDFAADLVSQGVVKGMCSAQDIVRLKACTEATLSYTSLGKRAEFLGFATPGMFAQTRWHKVRDDLLGEPFYKRLARRRNATAK